MLPPVGSGHVRTVLSITLSSFSGSQCPSLCTHIFSKRPCHCESSSLLSCTAGILITAYNQAEIFLPSTLETFALQDIPGSPRVWHTLTGTILCGGVYPDTSKSCLELQPNGAGWTPYSTQLTESRLAHSAWESPSGVVLLGGYYSGDTTELVMSYDSISQFIMNDTVRL